MKPLADLQLPRVRKARSGKVREVFDLGDRLLIVATDRISAYDCILPDAIPGKGEVLTQLSAFWFRRFRHVPTHFLSVDPGDFPRELRAHTEVLRGRSMLVRKAEAFPVECVVRAYLAGSAWREYQETGSIAGERLPPGLAFAAPLPAPIFTPATKAVTGHDENISWDGFVERVGEKAAVRLRDLSLTVFADASAHASTRGITIADTKFEFGLIDGQVVLIDECLTPDSSRFWPAESHRPGLNPPSYDKQFVRDYLSTLPWDKTPPAPPLPPEVIARTAEKYREIFERLTAP